MGVVDGCDEGFAGDGMKPAFTELMAFVRGHDGQDGKNKQI
jgi:hypothetical protein